MLMVCMMQEPKKVVRLNMQTNDGVLVVVSGSSRCGKTAKTERLTRPFKTVFVWDIEAQWCKVRGYKKVTSIHDLKNIVIAGRVGKFAYVSGGDFKADFERFCACVMHYGIAHGECACVAEELSDVTTVSKAGDNWGMLNRRGLKRGVSIFAISQRWAESDKTAFGNASEYYIFTQSSMDDARYMAKKTGIDVNRIWALNPLEFLHFQKNGKILAGGKVTF